MLMVDVSSVYVRFSFAIELQYESERACGLYRPAFFNCTIVPRRNSLEDSVDHEHYSLYIG